MIISIDGPAGSGKSTVAEALSKKLGFYHFNSGSLYRAITAYLIDCHIFSSEDKNFAEKINACKLNVRFDHSCQLVFVNNVDYTKFKSANSLLNLASTLSSDLSWMNVKKILHQKIMLS